MPKEKRWTAGECESDGLVFKRSRFDAALFLFSWGHAAIWRQLLSLLPTMRAISAYP